MEPIKSEIISLKVEATIMEKCLVLITVTLCVTLIASTILEYIRFFIR